MALFGANTEKEKAEEETHYPMPLGRARHNWGERKSALKGLKQGLFPNEASMQELLQDIPNARSLLPSLFPAASRQKRGEENFPPLSLLVPSSFPPRAVHPLFSHRKLLLISSQASLL